MLKNGSDNIFENPVVQDLIKKSIDSPTDLISFFSKNYAVRKKLINQCENSTDEINDTQCKLILSAIKSYASHKTRINLFCNFLAKYKKTADAWHCLSEEILNSDANKMDLTRYQQEQLSINKGNSNNLVIAQEFITKALCLETENPAFWRTMANIYDKAGSSENVKYYFSFDCDLASECCNFFYEINEPFYYKKVRFNDSNYQEFAIWCKLHSEALSRPQSHNTNSSEDSSQNLPLPKRQKHCKHNGKDQLTIPETSNLINNSIFKPKTYTFPLKSPLPLSVFSDINVEDSDGMKLK